MVLLTNPLLYDGRMLPVGKYAVLPEKLESALVEAGNAEWASRPATAIDPDEDPTNIEEITEESADLGTDDVSSDGDIAHPAGDQLQLELNRNAKYQPELTLGRGAPGETE